MSNYVRPLADVTAADAPFVGGKAMNLAKLIQADLPVPEGVAVGLNAFEENGTLREEAKHQITQYLKPDKSYAVRSSALAEDTDSASWAGQFETFLDIKPEQVLANIERCHNSAKSRAVAYAKDKTKSQTFDIAVIVQVMLKPEFAGVLFTKDPVTGNDQLVTEYVAGLGEELVSGRADPKHLVLYPDKPVAAPFNTQQLAKQASKVELLFGVPQDIEWVWADNKIWLVQARPITTAQQNRTGYYLGEPEDLFYWGPTRAKPMYMSDFMTATERLFVNMANDPDMPNPPKAISLFHDGKNVWLINADAFVKFTETTFEAYEKENRLTKDIALWRATSEKLTQLAGSKLTASLVDAWFYTEFAEFSLYGAVAALTKRLSRFDAQTRQDIWGAFTIPDNPTFLARIDAELAASQDPESMAIKYPWIQDGYDGRSSDAERYFKERLKVVGNDIIKKQNFESKRSILTKRYQLTKGEVNALNLARKLAEFMDDRKAWMMQTRHLVTQSATDVRHGWFFNDGQASLIGQDDTRELWQRYVDFKASSSAVAGVVASNGGKHFVNGEVVVINSATDTVADNKIVVVPSTSPSYVPLMRKAKALVTDHGGMMSHAAIVAREFNLPCIVGTKLATKVLKTGDNVVLDLFRGEVNK